MKSLFYFIGHRGTRVDYDENTILSFEKAIEYGANYIEFDVRKTKDEKLIILHDNSIDRTTNGTGLLKHFSLQEIMKYKTRINGMHVSQLSEVLDMFKNKVKFMIELKEENLSKEVLKIVNNRKLIRDCIFSGRNIRELDFIKSEYPKTRTCYNITKGIDLSLTEFLEIGHEKSFPFKIDFISLRASMITRKFIKTCQKNHIKVLSWDFLHYENPIKKIKALINKGIDGVLFDNYKNITLIKEWTGN